jgi:predicted ester cyclase
MSESEVRRVRQLLARYSDGHRDVVAELIAPAFFNHVPGSDEPSATEVFVGLAEDFKVAAPDLVVDVPDLAPGEDGLLHGTAVVEWTQTGPLWGVPPTGSHHRFEIPVILRPIDSRYAVAVMLAPPDAVAILRALEVVNPPDEMHLPPRHPSSIPDILVKVIFTGQVADKPCSHLGGIRVTRPMRDRCDDCGPDDVWPALRLCLSCGHVGCCDTSTNKHAKTHWETTGHPLMRSMARDEGWIWCYADNAAFQKRTLDRVEAHLAAAR